MVSGGPQLALAGHLVLMGPRRHQHPTYILVFKVTFKAFFGIGLCIVLCMWGNPVGPRSLCSPVLCFPVPKFSSLYVPWSYVPRSLCSLIPMLHSRPTYVPRYICSPVSSWGFFLGGGGDMRSVNNLLTTIQD